MTNPKTFKNWFKKDPFVHSIFLVFGIIFLLIICAVSYLLLRIFVLDKYYEFIIDKKFHTEVRNIPQMTVTKFMLWEGDSMVNLNIEGKGPVSFWYGINGVPRIQAIGPYPIPFVCFYVDNQNKKIGYAYDTALVLDKNTKLYEKWFPFQVNNLQDLVDKYDEIIRVLGTFPKDPEMVEFEDKTWGKRLVVKNPNPDFILRQRPNILYELISQITMPSVKDRSSLNKDLACDLYVTTR